MIVLLDMDDTLTVFMHTLVNKYNELYGTNFTPENDVLTWEIDETKFTQDLWSVFDKCPNIISTMPLKDKETPRILKRFKDLGHEFIVVTGTKYEHELEQKKELLTKLGIMEYMSDVIATRQKYIVEGDILVDDNISYLDEYKEHHPNAKTILMTASHNVTLNEDNRHIRVNNWSELEIELSKILEG